MSNITVARLVSLIVVALFCVGSVHQSAPTLLERVDPFFRQVVIERVAAAPGGEQAIHVTLHDPGAVTTIFQLAVTYANGVSQTVLDETMGSEATLSWVVPANAGAGAARFELTTSGCGCGDRSRPSSSVSGESTAEGHFYVQQ